MSDSGGAAYRIDGRTVERSAFYAVACDPARSVVVEACAGAGKTWMLVSRILRALLDGAQPQEILAITFTRKAAGEMRARLEEWLSEFADPDCPDEKRVQALVDRGLDPARARTASAGLAGLQERLLDAGRAVEIRTFHAWFSQLLRAAPLALLAELGLRPEMEVVDDLGEHRNAIFTRFHQAVLLDARLQADFITLVFERGRTQAQKWLDAAWAKRTEIELADAAGTLAASVPDAASLWPEFAGLADPRERLLAPRVDGVLRSLARGLVAHHGATPKKQGALLAQALALGNVLQRHAAVQAALFTASGPPRKHLDVVADHAEAIAHLEDIERARAQQSAHEEHLRMVRLSRVLLRELQAYKRERGLAEMADLEGCALALLRDSSLAGWVQERLDARIRHLLIDEFQDTSPLQWHALHAWLAGYAGAGGGASGQRPPGVFIVGDPKQSIYRFRRAEPRVFEAARAFVVEALGGTVLGCEHTRRNAPELLSALNGVFAAAQSAREFSGYRDHTTERSPQAGAGVFALPPLPRLDKPVAEADDGRWRETLRTPRIDPRERQREREAAAVAAAIEGLLASTRPDGARWRPGDVQVLCRKRESLRLLVDALAARQLPYVAPEATELMGSPEVRDVIALLDALASPRHALALAQALRSPVFGASDDELVTIATAAAQTGGDWWRALQQLPAPGPCLERARGLLRGWQAAAAELPPHDLLDRIFHEGDVMARTVAAVPKAKRQAAFDALNALLLQALALDGARYATPYGFVRALRRRALRTPPAAQGDAVNLLTIHGAKGLEAPVVFIMDTQPEAKNADTATLLVDWPVELPHPRQCAFVYSESALPTSLSGVFAAETLARQREELNSLYVAMTRARDALVLSATLPHKATPTHWWGRISAAVAGTGSLPPPPWQGAGAAPPAAVPADAGMLMLELPAAPEAPARDAPATPTAPPAANDATAALGQAVHRALEWLGGSAGGDVAAACAAAAREFGSTAARVERIVGSILASPACARFFDAGGLLWAGNEVAVSDAGAALRIDRLVARQEGGVRHWWVLDYKLHHRPEALVEYREQLERYRCAVQALQPGEPVHAAFITASGELVELDGPGETGASA